MELYEQAKSFLNEGVPSYKQTYLDVKWGVEYCLDHCNETSSFGPADFVDSLQKHASFDAQRDATIVVGASVGWTVLRIILSFLVFKVNSLKLCYFSVLCQ